MTNKDKKIIADNPDATPYELQLKGVSQAAFNELLQVHDNKVANELRAQKPRQVLHPIINGPAQPQTHDIVTHSNSVKLRNKRNGKVMEYEHGRGHSMARKYPSDFEIVH